jgi:putative phosphoribosyl transferase
MVFQDRKEAGQALAARLGQYAYQPDVILYALPRGGVLIAQEIADRFRLPLSVVITRKIGYPLQSEYAIGALAETGEVVWNEDERRRFPLSLLEEEVEKERREIERRVDTYRGSVTLPDLKGKTAILVDDGIATGYTMRAAIRAMRHQGAKRIVVAVPHGAPESVRFIEKEAEEVIALHEPTLYRSVGSYYLEFPQVTDEEVMDVLRRGKRALGMDKT